MSTITHPLTPHSPKTSNATIVISLLAVGLVAVTAIAFNRIGIAHSTVASTQAELSQALDKLLKDKAFYDRCRRNALAWTATLRWEGIFDRALSQALAGAAWA